MNHKLIKFELKNKIDILESKVSKLNSKLLIEGITNEKRESVHAKLKEVHVDLKDLNSKLQKIYNQEYQTA